MVQAVFCDFYGTIVHEEGPKMQKVAEFIYESGNAKSVEEVKGYWWKQLQKQMKKCCGACYKSQYGMTLRSLEETIERYESDQDAEKLCEMLVEYWSNPILYEDAGHFVNEMDIPIYLLDNSDHMVLKKAVRNCNLHPDDIITSEQSRLCKPKRGMFLYALEQTGFRADEVIHIGNSIKEDVRAPEAVGMRTIWINRSDDPVPERVTAAANLEEARKIIQLMK